MFVNTTRSALAHLHRDKPVRLLQIGAALCVPILIVLLSGCGVAQSSNITAETPTSVAELLPRTATIPPTNVDKEESADADATPILAVRATYAAALSKAWATTTRQAQLYPNLQPTPPVSFEIFKQYPGAKYPIEHPSGPDRPLFFDFETTDDKEAVEAYYADLAKKQGWQPLPGNGLARYYYYGDHGTKHVYGYYLILFASETGYNLKTWASVSINRSLPVYIGATDVSENPPGGDFDTGGSSVEFLTKDEPAAVLAFYNKLLPGENWELSAEESSDTRLFWKIGRSSHAWVAASREASGQTRVTVVRYYGCCG